jgi:hypothetical protein
MSAPAITIAQLNRLRPCREAAGPVRASLRNMDADKARAFTASDARAAGVSFENIVWAASAAARKDAGIECRLRLWVADCAARVLHIANDPRSTAAVVAARQFARGEIDDAALGAAWAAALDAASAAAWAAASAAAWAAAWAAGDAAWAAASAAGDAAWAAATAAEKLWQFDRLIERLSVNEPEDWPIPPELLAQVQQ